MANDNRLQRRRSYESNERGRPTVLRAGGSDNWRRRLYDNQYRSTSVPPETRDRRDIYNLSMPQRPMEVRNSAIIGRAMIAYDVTDDDLRVIIGDEANGRGTPLERIQRAEAVMQRFERLNEWTQNFMLREQGHFHQNDLTGLQEYYTRHSIMVTTYRENEIRALQFVQGQSRDSNEPLDETLEARYRRITGRPSGGDLGGPPQNQTRKRPPGPGDGEGPSQKIRR